MKHHSEKHNDWQCLFLILLINKESLAIRRIFSLVVMITKAKFSNSPNDF